MDFPVSAEDFRNCDACGGTCGEAWDDEYLGFLGLGNSYKKYDKQQRDQIYAELKAQFPDSTDCTTLQSDIDQLQNIIDQYTQKMATNCDKGCKQVSSRHLDMATKRQTEIKNLFSSGNCAAVAKAADQSQFLQQTTQLLDSTTPTNVSSTGSVIDTIKNGLGSLFGNSSTVTTTDANGNVVAAPSDNTKKYLMYGGIAVGGILLIVIIKKLA